MKRILTLSFLVFQIVVANAQQNDEATNIIRLQNKVKERDDDTLKTLLYDSLSIYYDRLYPDSAIGALEAQNGLELATKLDYKKGKALCLSQLGDINFSVFSNYTAALEYYTQANGLYDSFPATDAQKSSNLGEIASIYYLEGYYQKALDFFKRQYDLAKRMDSAQMIKCWLNIGACYGRLDGKDPSLHYSDSNYKYTHRAYELAKTKQDELYILYMIESNCNLADDLRSKGEYDSAYKTYRKYFNGDYIKYFRARPAFYYQTCLFMASYFSLHKQDDSSVVYGEKALEMAKTGGDYNDILSAEDSLANFYKKKGDFKTAFYYLKNELADKDSAFKKGNIEKIANIDFNEQKHKEYIQHQAEENKKKQEEAITHAGIGLFIVGFFILLLVLGRKKIKSRTIDFLGTLFLLMMFEFITLILHPRVALWTHDNQVTMFLILVGLAGLVIEPLHHKLEAWVRAKIEHKVEA